MRGLAELENYRRWCETYMSGRSFLRRYLCPHARVHAASGTGTFLTAFRTWYIWYGKSMSSPCRTPGTSPSGRG